MMKDNNSKIIKMKEMDTEEIDCETDVHSHKSYGKRKAEEYIAAGGAKVEIDPAWYFDRKAKKK